MYCYELTYAYRCALSTAFVPALSFATLCFICFQVLSDFLWISFFDRIVQELFNFHIFMSFPVFLLRLTSSFIPLWSEKMTTVDGHLLV